MGAYLFVHFVGRETTEDNEQVYFSVSRDGYSWELLNNENPVLKSTMGERGVRDPFIIKSKDGGKYFLIATDLSIYHRKNTSDTEWLDCVREGSRDIAVWESNDLVNWSAERMVTVAHKDAGNAWAPEAVYDREKDAYIVYWASSDKQDDYKYQRMYSSYTKDFETFTEPEIYIDNATDEEIRKGIAAANIDTTIIEHNGIYYRFTKNETKKTVIMDKSEHLDRGWERVKTYNLDEMLGYEGPTIFKFHNEDKWCLLLDHFAEQSGYEPFVTGDIDKGIFKKSGECKFDAIYRHGSVIQINNEEYDRLKKSFSTCIK